MSESMSKITKNAFSAIKNKGIVYALSAVRNKIYFAVFSHFVKMRRQRYFKFKGKKIAYLQTEKECAWNTERTIEIPIIWELLKENNPKRIMEIGNATHHFKNLHADVYDKYEKAKGVKNVDVIDISPEKKYDAAISVSTIEHVGWDEEDKNPRKILAAIRNIQKNCLNKGGVFIFTVPLGYNPYLDKLLRNNEIKMTEEYYFKRISLSNKWKEITKKDALTAKYHYPYECANAILMGVVKN